MPAIIDNEVYNRSCEHWRNEAHFLNLLESIIQPVRFNYLQRIIATRFAAKSESIQTLDIGCGGGFMSEDLARTGIDVVGLDQSEASLEHARSHAQENGLSITYRQGYAEHLPYPDQSFDLVCTCDVLEHVNDLHKTIQEAGRVLKPGGILFFDTINRTLLSRLSVIDIAQNIPFTAFMDKNVHVWHKLVKPNELKELFQLANLAPEKFLGIGPKRNPLSLVLGLIIGKIRKRSGSQLANVMQLKLIKSLAIHYMGIATKRG